MPEREATETTIHQLYRSYYADMGGAGAAPDVRAQTSEPVTDNVTAFRRPVVQRPKATGGSDGKPRLPVALIFACLVVVYVGFRYFLQ
jgi:hypothetical protein